MSKDKYPVVIIGAEQSEEALIRAHIADLAEVVGVTPDPKKMNEVMANGPAEIAILNLDDSPEEILAAAKEASLHSNVMGIVVSKNNDPQNILKAMRSGARDFAFISPDDPTDLRRAIGELGSLKSRMNAGARRGQIITVFSAKGGSGATTIASNLAGVLIDHEVERKDSKRKVLLLDFDFEMGDVLAFLDLQLRYTYHDVLSNIHRLDADILSQSLSIHSSGLAVLAEADQMEQSDEVSPEDLGRILGFLKRFYDFIVIDGLRDFRDVALVALDNADHVVLTATPDVPALKNANRCLRLFQRLGYTKDRVRLIVNRYEKSRKLGIDAISDALGRTIDGTVCNHFPSVIQSINEGSLLVQTQPNAKVAKDIRDLGYLFVKPRTVKKKGFLSFGRSA